MNPSLQPQMDSREADGLILAFQLVLTTTIMAGIGWLLDGLFGTRPSSPSASACSRWATRSGSS